MKRRLSFWLLVGFLMFGGGGAFGAGEILVDGQAWPREMELQVGDEVAWPLTLSAGKVRQWQVKHLPVGVRLDAKRALLWGKTKKPGLYKTTLTATRKDRSVVSETGLVRVLGDDVALNAALAEAIPYQAIAGMQVRWDCSGICALADEGRVQVMGLPRGLRWRAGEEVIAGLPLEVGPALVQVKVTARGKVERWGTRAIEFLPTPPIEEPPLVELPDPEPEPMAVPTPEPVPTPTLEPTPAAVAPVTEPTTAPAPAPVVAPTPAAEPTTLEREPAAPEPASEPVTVETEPAPEPEVAPVPVEVEPEPVAEPDVAPVPEPTPAEEAPLPAIELTPVENLAPAPEPAPAPEVESVTVAEPAAAPMPVLEVAPVVEAASVATKPAVEPVIVEAAPASEVESVAVPESEAVPASVAEVASAPVEAVEPVVEAAPEEANLASAPGAVAEPVAPAPVAVPTPVPEPMTVETDAAPEAEPAPVAEVASASVEEDTPALAPAAVTEPAPMEPVTPAPELVPEPTPASGDEATPEAPVTHRVELVGYSPKIMQRTKQVWEILVEPRTDSIWVENLPPGLFYDEGREIRGAASQVGAFEVVVCIDNDDETEERFVFPVEVVEWGSHEVKPNVEPSLVLKGPARVKVGEAFEVWAEAIDPDKMWSTRAVRFSTKGCEATLTVLGVDRVRCVCAEPGILQVTGRKLDRDAKRELKFFEASLEIVVEAESAPNKRPPEPPPEWQPEVQQPETPPAEEAVPEQPPAPVEVPPVTAEEVGVTCEPRATIDLRVMTNARVQLRYISQESIKRGKAVEVPEGWRVEVAKDCQLKARHFYLEGRLWEFDFPEIGEYEILLTLHDERGRLRGETLYRVTVVPFDPAYATTFVGFTIPESDEKDAVKYPAFVVVTIHEDGTAELEELCVIDDWCFHEGKLTRSRGEQERLILSWGIAPEVNGQPYYLFNAAYHGGERKVWGETWVVRGNLKKAKGIRPVTGDINLVYRYSEEKIFVEHFKVPSNRDLIMAEYFPRKRDEDGLNGKLFPLAQLGEEIAGSRGEASFRYPFERYCSFKSRELPTLLAEDEKLYVPFKVSADTTVEMRWVVLDARYEPKSSPFSRELQFDRMYVAPRVMQMEDWRGKKYDSWLVPFFMMRGKARYWGFLWDESGGPCGLVFLGYDPETDQVTSAGDLCSSVPLGR